MAAGRFGIPALVHEECLTGLVAWRATVYPRRCAGAPASTPGSIERMAAQIGATMRRLGVHQGLAPVLDVVRDLRWGRVEETIGEDPYLVGRSAAPTCAGWSPPASWPRSSTSPATGHRAAGRNLAPVSIGPRELADVLLPPFEMALAAGARSVMNSYTDLDGVPVGRRPELLTGLLRGGLRVHRDGGRRTTSRSSFLHGCTAWPATPGEAAGLALAAGIDVELPDGGLLRRAAARRRWRTATVAEDLIDRAAGAGCWPRRCELGLLDPDWTPEALAGPRPSRGAVSWTTPPPRALALEVARRSIVLLRNDGILPLAPRQARGGRRPARRRARTPCSAATPSPATSACSTRTSPAGIELPDRARGAAAPTRPATRSATRRAARSLGGDDGGIAAAARRPRGMPTCASPCSATGPGCSATAPRARAATRADLRLPGRQEELLDALLDTGTPVVLVLLAGGPTSCPGRPTGWPPRCAGSSPARRAPPRGRRAERAGEPLRAAAGQLPGGRGHPAVHLPDPGAGPAQRGQPASTRRRCTRSGTGCRYAPAHWESVTSRTRRRSGRPTGRPSWP